MNLAFVNESTLPGAPTFSQLEEIAAAIGRQIEEHYAPMWQSAPCVVQAFRTLADVPTTPASPWVVIAILDNADRAGVLGYHDTTPDGRPYGRVFLGPILANGGTLSSGPDSLSATLSHESLETVGDPYASWWSDVDGAHEEALELCDRVEGDSYEIDGVSVSNFLGPRAFSFGAGPYDYLGKLDSPRAMTSGGYTILRRGGPSGTVSQKFGEAFPEWKKALKTGRRRRAA